MAQFIKPSYPQRKLEVAMLYEIEQALIERLKAQLGPSVDVVSSQDAVLSPTRPLKRPEVLVAYAGGPSSKHGMALDLIRQEQQTTWVLILRWRPQSGASLALIDMVKQAIVGFKPRFAIKPFTHVDDSPPDFEDALFIYSLTFSASIYLTETPVPDTSPVLKKMTFARDDGHQITVEKP
ncbi:hypothetical protein HQN60_15600 [Deefgea piscis]|uniref:Uncharacterized protein n=1 Tax=Deefgea piscis TaxID=2739061 RepID=A0A6M8SXT6_9NEIS|nr:Gp37 family protein [Deefgea piscis]QKJ68030.1 hypothetical protein HQN60_15600 [Deefgea piscis]